MSINVETNNISEVLRHFNDAGVLKDPATRITIDCQICQVKFLGLINPDSDKMTLKTHEAFAVLQCGHAFGMECLKAWIKSKGGVSLATCPSCREPITCEKKHAEFGLFGSNGTTKAQARDVVALRKLPKGCSKCFQQVRAEQHVREKALRDQQAAAEAARVTEQVEARLRTVEPTVRAAATLGRENEPRWDAIQTSLLQLQGDIQVRNRVEHPNNQNTRLRQVYRKASETINRRTRQSSQADEAMWEFVDARVSDVRFAAEDRLERERRNADIAERIAAHLSAVRELVAESMGNYNF